MEPQEFGGGEGGQSYVVAGATITCSCGNKQAKLKMPLSHGVYIKDKAQMNISDHQPISNITPFGLCNTLANPAVAAATAANKGVLTPMPCIPVVTMPWINGKADKLVENQPALLNISANMCLYGGIITIENDGQE